MVASGVHARGFHATGHRSLGRELAGTYWVLLARADPSINHYRFLRHFRHEIERGLIPFFRGYLENEIFTSVTVCWHQIAIDRFKLPRQYIPEKNIHSSDVFFSSRYQLRCLRSIYG